MLRELGQSKIGRGENRLRIEEMRFACTDGCQDGLQEGCKLPLAPCPAQSRAYCQSSRCDSLHTSRFLLANLSLRSSILSLSKLRTSWLPLLLAALGIARSLLVGIRLLLRRDEWTRRLKGEQAC